MIGCVDLLIGCVDLFIGCVDLFAGFREPGGIDNLLSHVSLPVRIVESVTDTSTVDGSDPPTTSSTPKQPDTVSSLVTLLHTILTYRHNSTQRDSAASSTRYRLSES
jgi:hypothetical protein